LTIDKRITLGFAVVIVTLAAVAVLTFTSIANIEEVVYGNALDGALAQKEVDHLNWAHDVAALLEDDAVHELTAETDHKQCGFGQWLYSDARREAEQHVPGLAETLARIEEPHRQLHASAVAIADHYLVVEPGLGTALREAKTEHLAWAHRLKDALVDPSLTSVGAELDPRQSELGQWLRSDRVAELRGDHPRLDRLCGELTDRQAENYDSARHVADLLQRGQRQEAARFYMNDTKPRAYEVLAGMDAIIGWQDDQLARLAEARQIQVGQTRPLLREVQDLLHEARDQVADAVMSDEQMLATAKSTQRNVTVVGIVGVVLGALLAFLITRSIVQALRRVVDGLNSGADQTASAATQVSSASQSLARGASEQAASLEETSSSVEETTGSIKRTASSAEEALTTAVRVREDAESGTAAMQRMNTAIDEIKNGSDETAKIIKTIDEIAFQTNLLALNAAVEAARAGEAGKGFAVVAEEVRNLAQRAGEAARNTAALIEQSVAKADNGVAITQEVADMLTKITEGNRRMNQLVEDIAGASNDQARSVGQINDSVSQLDQVSQDNAANAEESASAAEELTAQADELRVMVGDLQGLLGGPRSHAAPVATGQAGTAGDRPAAAPWPGGRTRPTAQDPAPGRRTESSRGQGAGGEQPEDVVPLDEEELASL
jgi:methyl-accepting chemotaxis protein